MSIEKLISADGRIGRLTFWCIFLGIYLFALLASGMRYAGTNAVVELGGLLILLALVSLALVTAVKRCHDHGWSGVWAWMALIPIVGIFWFGVMPGQRGANKYGDPESGSPFRPSEPL